MYHYDEFILLYCYIHCANQKTHIVRPGQRSHMCRSRQVYYYVDHLRVKLQFNRVGYCSTRAITHALNPYTTMVSLKHLKIKKKICLKRNYSLQQQSNERNTHIYIGLGKLKEKYISLKKNP